MMTVGIWPGSDLEKVCDVVLVRECDKIAFLDLVSGRQIRTPARAFIPPPNGYGHEGHLLEYLVWLIGEGSSKLLCQSARTLIKYPW